MTLTIAIDIGGTHIRVAAYEPNSTTPLAQYKTKSLTHTPGTYERLVAVIETLWQKANVDGFDIGTDTGNLIMCEARLYSPPLWMATKWWTADRD